MRKLVVTENITLDGVIDMAEGWFDPLNEDVDQSDITAATTEHQQAADALLVGRNTFEILREFWPKQTDDPTGVSDYLNAVDNKCTLRMGAVAQTYGDAVCARLGRSPSLADGTRPMTNLEGSSAANVATGRGPNPLHQKLKNAWDLPRRLETMPPKPLLISPGGRPSLQG